MLYEKSYSLTKDEFIAGLSKIVENLRQKDPSRHRQFWEVCAIFVTLGFAGAFVFPRSSNAIDVSLLAVWLALTALGAFWRKRSLGTSFDPRIASVSVSFTDKAVIERNPFRERRWSWEGVIGFYETGNVLAVELIGGDLIVLPHRLWDSPNERQAFLGAAQERRGGVDGVTEALRSQQGRPFPTERTLGSLMSGLLTFCLLLVFGTSLQSSWPASVPLRLAIVAVLFVVAGLASFAVALVSGKAFDRIEKSSPTRAKMLAMALFWLWPALWLLWHFGRGVLNRF